MKKLGRQTAEVSSLLENVTDSIFKSLYVIAVSSYIVEISDSENPGAVGGKCYEKRRNLPQPCSFSGKECPVDIVRETGRACITEDSCLGNEQNICKLVTQPVFNESGELTHVSQQIIDTSIRQKSESAKSKSEKGVRDNFDSLANISHEIRTPLNGIVGIANLLKIKRVPEQYMKYITMINDSAEIVLDYVNNILTMAKMESGNIVVDSLQFSTQKLMSD